EINNWDIVFRDQMELYDKYYTGGWIAWAWDHEWRPSADQNRTIAYTMLLYDYSDINFVGQIWADYVVSLS
ncbi:MAG: hypothetical protein ACFFDN_28010, partial [Candidatus Hodarchaeota archaeon]